MERQSQPAGATRQKSNVRHLLSVCESHLQKGDYVTCRDFAVKAQTCYPNDPGPAQILTICSILNASSYPARPDWYSILHVPRYFDDLNAIHKNFNLLCNLLNPTKNPYSFAAEAHEWVIKAWGVLSEPSLKAVVDKELRMEENNERNGSPTFWTRCPKCFCMYEYEQKYNGCLMKCQNAKCWGAFTAEPIPAYAAPPPEVVNGEVYVCYGLSPLGGEGWKYWWPFVSRVSARMTNNSNVIRDEGLVKKEKGDVFLEISDDEKEDKDVSKSGVTDDEKEDKDVSKSGVTDDGFSGHEEVKTEFVEKQNNGGKMVMKRTKMTASANKKLMGKGIRISLTDIFREKGDDVVDMEVNNGGSVGGSTNGEEEKGVSDAKGFEIMDGIDDVYVSLGSDLVFGNLGPL